MHGLTSGEAEQRLGLPPLADLLGGGWPPPAAWAFPLAGAILVILADAAFKTITATGRRNRRMPPPTSGAGHVARLG